MSENIDINKWYTVRIITGRLIETDPAQKGKKTAQLEKQYETHEFKNCTAGQAAQFRQQVWSVGIRVVQSPGVWEILSPFTISQFFIIEQNEKITE